MGRLRFLVTVGVLVGAVAVPASAAAVWVNTPRHVAHIIVHHFRTPDGRQIVAARCAGLRSSAHRGTPAGEAFHRLVCAQIDRVAREFVVRVTVTGPLSLRVTAVACSDKHSRVACP